MANALRQLGLSVHDFEEHYQLHLDDYLDYLEGRVGEEIFTDVYRDVDVVVDQPACTLWRIILRQFPDAKVILMERENSEVWFKSYYGMLLDAKKHIKGFFDFLLPWSSHTHNKLDRLNKYNVILSTGTDSMTLFYKSSCDRVCSSLWMDQYERHNAAVRALVSDDQLLVYRVGEGWERLCQFLGKNVPQEQFPHDNRAGGDKTVQNTYKSFSVFQEANREVVRNCLVMMLSSSAFIGASIIAWRHWHQLRLI